MRPIMLGMGYELITRYEVGMQEPLDPALADALTELSVATEGLIRTTGASRRADFVLNDDDHSPALAGVPGVPPEFHAERIRSKLWYVAAYLPTVQRRQAGITSMNYASYSVSAGPDRPQVADLGRYFWAMHDSLSGSKRSVTPRQLTPQAVLEALIPAVEMLSQHYEGMDGHWRVT